MIMIIIKMFLNYILHSNNPESSPRTQFSAGIAFPFIQITIDPGWQNDVAPMAHPKLNEASESIKRSGFVAPVNAITVSPTVDEISCIRF